MERTIKDRTIEFVRFKGITMKTFEMRCGLSSGYVTSMRKGFGADKLNNVLTAYPELNRDWLLYGEGQMLKSSIVQTSSGDNSPNINGNGNHVNTSELLGKALDEIAELRRQNKEQFDRFMTIIERLTQRG